jgi:hypothetical protein
MHTHRSKPMETRKSGCRSRRRSSPSLPSGGPRHAAAREERAWRTGGGVESRVESRSPGSSHAASSPARGRRVFFGSRFSLAAVDGRVAETRVLSVRVFGKWRIQVDGRESNGDFRKFWLTVEITPPQCPSFSFVPLIPKQVLRIKLPSSCNGLPEWFELLIKKTTQISKPNLCSPGFWWFTNGKTGKIFLDCYIVPVLACVDLQARQSAFRCKDGGGSLSKKKDGGGQHHYGWVPIRSPLRDSETVRWSFPLAMLSLRMIVTFHPHGRRTADLHRGRLLGPSKLFHSKICSKIFFAKYCSLVSFTNFSAKSIP